MSELGDVTQIIKVGFEGCEMAVRLGVGGIDLLRRAVMFFVGMLNHEKKAGKTSMRDMLKDGGPLEVFQFDEKDFKQVKKLAKKYGIQYTELPNVNADGKREIVFPADATPRVNLLAEKLNNAKIIDLEDYLSKDEEVDKLLDYLKDYTPSDGKAFTVEEQKEYETVYARVREVAAQNNTKLVEADLNPDDIVDMKDDKVKIATQYDSNVFIWFDKRDIFWDEDQKKMRVFLDKSKEYEVQTQSGMTYKKVDAEELAKNGIKKEDKKTRGRKQTTPKPGKKKTTEKTTGAKTTEKSKNGGKTTSKPKTNKQPKSKSSGPRKGR